MKEVCIVAFFANFARSIIDKNLMGERSTCEKAFCHETTTATLTGAGRLENLLLIGFVFDTVLANPKGNRSQPQTRERRENHRGTRRHY